MAIPVDTLSDADRERVRYHLGYLETSPAASIQLGVPRPLQTVFLLEQGLENLTNGYAVHRVRCILDRLDDIERRMICALDTLGVESLGNLKLHPLKSSGRLSTDSLEREYQRWSGRLADVFGVPKYPYAERNRRRGPGTTIPVR